jgi:hypothetical protein
MCIEECPKCKKPSFEISLKTHTGKCRNCGYKEKVDEKVWNLKYDDGYKELRATLKYSSLGRDSLFNYFELDKLNSPYAQYLLTCDVIKALETEAPEIYNRLPKYPTPKCAP